ncbi:MAG TPA: hypothetical protein VLE22_20800, partial [Bryobacteraceae bacterium]|nr:hypothetical protein [Bryobacteraceae bacterium]
MRKEFETHLTWAPSLDAAVPTGTISRTVNNLIRFELDAIHAAKVRNVSKVGSHANLLSRGNGR